MFQLKKGEK